MGGITRRRVVAGLAAGALCPAPLLAAPTGTLGGLAAQKGVLFGASAGAATLSDPAYGALYVREARVLTTDTALKFDYLRPDRETFSFGPADALVDFARDAAMAARGHTLAWNENLPDWVRRLSAAEATAEFDRHVDTVAGRYAGRLHSWDVVNEPFWPGHGRPGGYRDGPWLAAMGPGYVERALRRARAADPMARLCVNEAHCEILDGWGAGIRPRLLALVDDLRHRGAPLDAIGLQGHLQPQWPHDDAAFAAFLAELAARDLDVYVTELDVNDASLPADPARRDAMVAARIASFLSHVLAVPRVRLVVTWQLADRYSGAVAEALARDPRARRLPRPLPYDMALAPKPARAAMAQAFSARPAPAP